MLSTQMQQHIYRRGFIDNEPRYVLEQAMTNSLIIRMR